MNNKDKPLWSDDKTWEQIDAISELDAYSVVINLHEDVLCLKENIQKLKVFQDY